LVPLQVVELTEENFVPLDQGVSTETTSLLKSGTTDSDEFIKYSRDGTILKFTSIKQLSKAKIKV
jgi:hypothetical protein